MTSPLSATPDIARPKKRAVTTKDVAALAGVDRALVSVVLNGAKSTVVVSEAHRQKILQAADQLNYRRNGMAAGIRTGKFGAIALLLSSHSHASTLPISVLDGIQEEVEARGINLLVHKLPVATLRDREQLPKVLREWSCDGLLVDMTHAITTEMREAIATTNLPAVWFNVPDEFDAVRPDDFEAGRQAVHHLAELGHRRICYMDLSHPRSKMPEPGVVTGEHYSVYDRFYAVKNEAKAAGLEITTCFRPEDVPLGNSEGQYQKLYETVKNTLIQAKPTAIISYAESDFTKFAVIRDLNLRVPEDLSLLSFGTESSWFQQYHLTQMAVPEFKMGQELVRLLFDKIESPQTKFPTVILPFQLDPGNSSGPCLSL